MNVHPISHAILQTFLNLIVHDTKEWCRIWRKTVLWFGKWHEEYDKFSPEHKNEKISKWDFGGILLSKVEYLWA